MERVRSYFEEISRIPRCSGKTEAMRRYLREAGERFGYAVAEDAAGNVLCRKGEAKMAYQAHYDMVCIGTDGGVAIREEGEFLTG